MKAGYLRLAVVAGTLATIVALALYFLYLPGGVREVATPPAAKLVEGFILESPAFENGGEIPGKYTCDGLDVSPPLSWKGYPAQTVSFALIVEDPDAPGGTFTHWIIFNIPPEVSSLEEAVPGVGELPGGIIQGRNDFGRIGYGGPCPPPGSAHHYIFRLMALDTELNLRPGVGRSEFLEAVEGHIIAEAKLTGIYGR